MKKKYRDDIEAAILLCHKGAWEEALRALRTIVDKAPSEERLPGVVYSNLGYTLAKVENNVVEGLRLCHLAIGQEFYDADHYFNLARVHLIAENREGVWDNLNKGLRLDPKHRKLQKLKKMFGVRRKPVLPFLHRSNPINRYLGRLRHSFSAKPA